LLLLSVPHRCLVICSELELGGHDQAGPATAELALDLTIAISPSIVSFNAFDFLLCIQGALHTTVQPIR